MAEPLSLAGYFDRAEHVSILAGDLGKAFQEESEQAQNRQASDLTAWSRHKPAFLAYWQTLVRMAPEIDNPPDGSAAVAEWLAKAKQVAVEIRDLARTPDAWKFTDYFSGLNSVALGLATSRQACPRDAGIMNRLLPVADSAHHRSKPEDHKNTSAFVRWTRAFAGPF